MLFWNQNREVTESTIANFVARFGEKYFTPPVTCGLLPGVFRSWLLNAGQIQEKSLMAIQKLVTQKQKKL